MRDDVDAEERAIDLVHRERDAVERDRALRRDEAREARRRLERHAQGFALAGDACQFGRAVDVAGDDVAAQFVADLERAFEVDGVLDNAEAEQERVFSAIDLSKLGADEARVAVQEAGESLQGSLNLTEGPIIRGARFEFGGVDEPLLMIVIHHLAVDGVSWRILLEDLEQLHKQWVDGERLSLPAKTTSFQQWAEALEQASGTERMKEQVEYWKEQGRGSGRLPVDYTGRENSVASSASVVVSLSERETRGLLTEVPRVYGTQINDVLLTALGQAVGEWAGSEEVVVDLEGHGREEIEEASDAGIEHDLRYALGAEHLHLVARCDVAE